MKTRVAVVAAIAAAVVGNSAGAFPQPYRISGTVTAVDAPLGSRFKVGDSVSGQVLIETVPGGFNGGTAFYNASGFSASIGSGYTVNSNEGSLRVGNEVAPGLDHVILDFTSPNGLVGPTVDGHFPDYFDLNMNYDSSGLSSSNLLPHFPLATLNDLSNLRFDVNDSIEVRFRVTDFSAVPEPSVLSYVVGIGGGMMMRRRRG